MELNKTPCLLTELEQMSTSQLEELINREMECEHPDAGKIRAMMDILNVRLEQSERDYSPAQMEAWEQYQKNCAMVERISAEQKRRKTRRYIQRASVAAVLVIACLGFITVPRASGANNFLDFLTKWTDNVFAIFGPSNADDVAQQEYVFQTDNPGLQEVYNEVAGMGVTDPVVPMKLPDGAELDELKVTHTPTRTYIYARFIAEDVEIILEYSLYGTDTLREYSWDETETGKYECDGISHDVVSNDGSWVAVWKRDNLECYVAVDCQEDVLYDILRSIYTTEDIA